MLRKRHITIRLHVGREAYIEVYICKENICTCDGQNFKRVWEHHNKSYAHWTESNAKEKNKKKGYTNQEKYITA
jgi:hypothetical protein